MRTLVVDCDGTICNVEHRRGLLPDWNAFFEAMDDDTPVEAVADIVATYKASPNIQIVLCTGRPEKYRERTAKWMDKHAIPFDLLFMRKDGDYRADYIIKREMLVEMQRREFDILFVIDDRTSVVERCWREAGLVCLQAAKGDFDEKVFAPGKLTLLIGPSGGGKTTYALENFDRDIMVSSDRIRAELCGDFRDQSKNNQVFHALHSIVRARLYSGLDTVVDATNLKNKDRKAILDNAPANAKIEYLVIDRPMAEKKETAGWRADVIAHGKDLLSYHAEVFANNLKMILAGDNDTRVTVKDLRR